MRVNEYGGMLKSLIGLIFFSVMAVATNTSAAGNELIDDVRASLGRSSEVVLVFTDATDQNRSWTIDDYIRSATAKLDIYCRNNCHWIMEVVLHQLQGAKDMSDCPRGNKFLIIHIGVDRDLGYFHYDGGRVVEYRNRCYLTKSSIRDVIHIFDFF